MTVQIRDASADDLDQLLTIEETCFNSDQISRRQMRYLLTQAKAITFVGIMANSVVGYITILLPQKPRGARIYSLAVLPNQQGKGIGKQLLKHAIQAVRQHNYSRLYLEVRQTATTTVSLYQSFGFHITRTTPHYYADGADAYKMNLFL